MSLSDASCWRHLREPNVVTAYNAKFSQNESWNWRLRLSGCCFILLVMSQLDLNSAALSVSYAPYPQNGGSSKEPGTLMVRGACAETTHAVGLGIAPGIAPASSLPRLWSIGSAAERDVFSRINCALTRSRTISGALRKEAMIASKMR